jgi:type I restriction enzyme S subunit
LKLAGEWQKTTIGQQVTLQRGIDITKTNQRPGTIPVISSSGISSYHDTSQVSAPGVILGRKGVVGSVFFVETDYWPHDTTLWVRDFHGNDPRFVYYFFKNMAFQLASMDVGSANPTLNRNHVHPIEVLWPPLPEQRAIAGILGALDDKIESNRRTSRTLERVARSIFQAWFVDFEPVKAKAAGERFFLGMPKEAFDALPTRFVKSEMGQVPEGWEVGCIGDVVSVRGGGTPSTKVEEYWEGGTHYWLTPKDLSGMKDPILLSTDRKITDKGLDKISSDLLPVGTVLLSSRAPVGYLVITGVPTAINQGFIAMVCDGPLPPLYVYHWTHSVMDEIKSRASGTTFPEISKTAFRPIRVLIPTKGILAEFEDLTTTVFYRIASASRETAKLNALRDYLLPLLLSGDMRVSM